MPEKYIQLTFKERIFTGQAVNPYSSHSQWKLDMCTDLSCNSVKHVMLPLLLDLAASTTLLTFAGARDCLSQQEPLMGATRTFIAHATKCKRCPYSKSESYFHFHLRQASLWCADNLATLAGLLNAVWALVWSQSQANSAHV